MSFEGMHVVVTGGTGALGSAVCGAFLDQGAFVHASYIVDEELGRLPEKMAENDRLTMRRLDLTCEQEVKAWFSSLPDLYVLVNVAGGFAMNPIADLRLKDWEYMLDMNLKTVFLCCREALQIFSDKGEGRIINIGAFAATRPTSGMGAYTTSKNAVLHLTGVLAEETLSSKITVNAVLPTIMDTPGNRSAMPDADFSDWVPLENVAGTILFLAHKDSWHITGAQIPVRGHL